VNSPVMGWYRGSPVIVVTSVCDPSAVHMTSFSPQYPSQRLKVRPESVGQKRFACRSASSAKLLILPPQHKKPGTLHEDENVGATDQSVGTDLISNCGSLS